MNELCIDERSLEDGSFGRTLLRLEDDEVLALVVDGVRVGPLPQGAVEAVMDRFGGALAEDLSPSGPGIPLGADASLRPLRHLARYDVIARDYVVLARPGRDPQVLLATTLAGALRHLALAMARA